MPSAPIAEQVAAQLAPFLGEFNAKIAVKTFSQRSLKRGPETLTAADVPALLDALRPTLYTLVGRASTDALLERLRGQVK